MFKVIFIISSQNVVWKYNQFSLIILKSCSLLKYVCHEAKLNLILLIVKPNTYDQHIKACSCLPT